MNLIEVENLQKSFGSLTVLDGVSFTVAQGETVAVIGPSGSGKSTMLRCLIHLEKANGGSIRIGGETLCANGVYQSEQASRRICRRMGMVFQNFHLFPHMNVLDNLTLAPMSVQKLSKEEAQRLAREQLGAVGLSEKEQAYPSELSGGQKQRVAIARALMMQPDILLFDEPTSSLDPQLTAEVLAVMKGLAKSRITMIVVTHEMGFAREAADQILFMCDREIIERGTPFDIFERPQDPRIRDFINSIL